MKFNSIKSQGFLPQLNRTHMRGVTLVELMVAMVISLVLSLAIYGVLNVNEGKRRTTSSTNDIDQSGTYTTFQLNKFLRSAGSGFGGTVSTLITSAGNAYGCNLQAKNGAAVLLPANGLPDPFSAIPAGLRLAPVIIFPDAATVGTGPGATTNGDVLMMMSGSGGLAEIPTDFAGTPTATSITLNTTANFRANDVVLAMDNVGGAGVSNCYIEQVASNFVATTSSLVLNLNSGTGALYHNGITSLSTGGITSSLLNLGQMPLFTLLGVGQKNQLMSYDLLSIPSTNNPSAFADNVYAMYALYGIVPAGSAPGTAITWTTATGQYTPTSLLAGTNAASALLQTIKAVKVGIIMQAALPEKIPTGQAGIASPDVSYASGTPTVSLFSSTGTTTTKTVALNANNRRYRVYETTVPIRNSLMIP